MRTVVNLRGGREHGSWQLQKDACDRLGLDLVEFVVRSREAPDRDTILGAKDFFDGLAIPGGDPLQVGRRPGRLRRGALPHGA